MTKMTKAQLVDENIRLRIECDRLESQLGSANAIIKDLDEQIRRKDIALGKPQPQPGDEIVVATYTKRDGSCWNKVRIGYNRFVHRQVA